MAIIATVLMLIAVFLCSVAFRYFIYTIAITGFLIGGMCKHTHGHINIIAITHLAEYTTCSYGDMDDIDSSRTIRPWVSTCFGGLHLWLFWCWSNTSYGAHVLLACGTLFSAR